MMRYNFSVSREFVEDQVCWVARSKSVSTIVGQGDTPEEAIAELEANEASWLELAADLGIDIPDANPERKRQYSGKFMTRISPTAHAMAAEFAAADGISLNQYVSDAIAYYNGCHAQPVTSANVLAEDFHRTDCKEM